MILLRSIWVVVFAKTREQLQALRAKLKLAVNVPHPSGPRPPFGGPENPVLAGAVIDQRAFDPASLQQFLQQGGQIGTYKGLAVTFAHVEGRDTGLKLPPNPSFLEFCNEAAVAEAKLEFIGLENEARIGADNWVCVWPYGDARQTVRGQSVIQRFDKEAADGMVEWHDSLAGKMVRLWKGVPLFNGHPDSDEPEIANLYTDKRVHGAFIKLAARADGLWGLLQPEPSGKELVNSRIKIKLSPRGLAFDEPDAIENGVPIYRPVVLASVGLTNRPNIKNAPTLPLLNEELLGDGEMNHEFLKFLCGLLSFANEAPAAAETPKPELLEKVKTGLTTLGEKAQRTDVLTTELANEKAAHGTTTAQVTTLTTELANERTARIGDLLKTGIEGGKITAADKADWERRLKLDFANESIAFGKLAKTVKTEPATPAAGKKNAGGNSEGVLKVTELINEEMSKLPANTKNAWDVATANARRKNPTVFQTIKAADAE